MVKSRMGKPRRNPVTDEQIIECYRQNHSAYKTAAALGIGSTTVERVLTKYAEPRPGLELYRKSITKFRGQEQAIREAYETGVTYQQLREQFGECSDYALKHAIKRAGGALREDPAPLIKLGEIEKVREMNAAGMGQIPISLALGRSQSFVGRLMRKHGIKPIADRMKGDQHPNWKGGRGKDSHGYFRVWLDPNDPLTVMSFDDNSILEHRLVMARKLGRPLRRSETVHHINGDRADNRPENLELRQGKHGKHSAMVCLDCGSHNVGHAALK